MSKHVKITRIHPEGATLTRANGSVVKVGDVVTEHEAVTLTIPHDAPGGSVGLTGDDMMLDIRERRAGVTPPGSIGKPAPYRRAALNIADAPPVLAVLAKPSK